MAARLPSAANPKAPRKQATLGVISRLRLLADILLNSVTGVLEVIPLDLCQGNLRSWPDIVILDLPPSVAVQYAKRIREESSLTRIIGVGLPHQEDSYQGSELAEYVSWDAPLSALVSAIHRAVQCDRRVVVRALTRREQIVLQLIEK